MLLPDLPRASAALVLGVVGAVCAMPSPAGAAPDETRTPDRSAGSAGEDASATAPAYARAMDEGNRALAESTVAGFQRAADAFQRALAARPGDAEATLQAAEAQVRAMRVQTAGNQLLLEGANDSAAHQRIWRAEAPSALRLAKQSLQARPQDPRARALFAEAYMYQSSSQGIVQAILEGAADQYLKNADALLETQPPYDLAAGHIYRASYYVVAPWPLADEEKALFHAEQAVRAFPRSVRNHYVLGVIRYRQGDRAGAQEAMERSLAGTCRSPSERDLCGFFRREARRALKKLGAPAP